MLNLGIKFCFTTVWYELVVFCVTVCGVVCGSLWWF